MKIETLNIALPQTEIFNNKKLTTGIRKRPVSIPIKLGRHGFEGDGVANLKHHGGTDKAVCVYGLNHYIHWEIFLGQKLPSAAFGENFSLTFVNESDIFIGDIFKVGTACVQVSQPRQPCNTLAARFGRPDLVKAIVNSGFTGFYLRVLEEGIVQSGDELICKKRDPLGISINFANNIYHHDRTNKDGIEAVLAVPALSESWKKSFIEIKKNRKQ